MDKSRKKINENKEKKMWSKKIYGKSNVKIKEEYRIKTERLNI